MKISYNLKDMNNWTSIFMKATIIQMILASALTLFLLVGIIGPLRLLSFVISYNASDSPFAGAWFNFGYFSYLFGVVGIGMMAMIYRYFEHTLHIYLLTYIRQFKYTYSCCYNFFVVARN